MRNHQLMSVVIVLAVALCFWTACSKQDKAPTAPPADPPVCLVDPSQLDFGTVVVGSSAQRYLVIRNTGGGTLAGGLVIPSTDFTLVGNTSYRLAAGDTAAFLVRFVPQHTGAAACTIGTGTSLCGAVPCVANAIPAEPACAVYPQTLDFGTVAVNAQAVTKTFELSNVAGGTLTGTVSSDTCTDFGIVGSGAYSLTYGQSATITVHFAPTIGGMQTCSFSTGSASCGKVYVMGTGTPPAGGQIAYLDFGRLAAGQTRRLPFTLYSSTRCGSNPYAICTLSYDPQFVVVGQSLGSPYSMRCDLNYSMTLPYTYNVNFTPESVGTKRTTIEIQCEYGPGAGFGGTGYVVCTGVGF